MSDIEPGTVVEDTDVSHYDFHGHDVEVTVEYYNGEDGEHYYEAYYSIEVDGKPYQSAWISVGAVPFEEYYIREMLDGSEYDPEREDRN